MARGFQVHAGKCRNRAAFGANVTVNWNIFGPAGSVLNCFCLEPEGPVSVGINTTSGILRRVNEGVDSTGSFALGAPLLVQQLAPFIGVVSSTDDITDLIFPPSAASDLAIIEMSLRVPSLAPEPPGLLLLIPGTALCFGLGWHKKGQQRGCKSQIERADPNV